MSSSTALLPKDRKKDDHPIFLRVCHSPWTGIGQRALVLLRGSTLAYLIVTFLMILDFEITRNKSPWLIPFKFSNFQYFIQTLYHAVAFSWTFMHLHYPHHASQTQTSTTRLQKILSPPRQDATTKNREWFSIFYTAANVFPYVSAFMFWVVLLPSGKAELPYDVIKSGDWFLKFYVIHKWVVSCIVSFIEVFFFCSIKRQSPVYAHVIGLAILSWIYLAWVYVGYVVTDKYAWYFLNHKLVGWDHVIAAFASFAALVNLFFAVVYNITFVREKLTKKGEHKNTGYQQLPQ